MMMLLLVEGSERVVKITLFPIYVDIVTRQFISNNTDNRGHKSSPWHSSICEWIIISGGGGGARAAVGLKGA